MSGGYFNYDQNKIEQIADDIERVIRDNDSEEKNEWGERIGYGFSPQVIERFEEAIYTLRQAAEMAQRVDWLLSWDDGEQSFLRRWDEEVRPYCNQITKLK